MSRVNSNVGQEIVSEDVNKISSLLQRELYDRVFKELLQRQVDGFFDTSFLVSFASSTSVSVAAGLGFQEDTSVDSAEPTLRPIYQAASSNLNIAVPDTVNDRIDVITVKHNLIDGNTESRKFKNSSSGAVTNENFVVDKEWSVTFNVITGTPAASPVAPATPAGEIKIATLAVAAVSGMSGSGDVTDNRTLLPVGGQTGVNTTGVTRLTVGAAVSISQLMGEIDAFLVSGLQEYTDMVDQVTDAAVPAASRLRLYNKGGVMFTRDSGGTVTPLGSGSGGGGGGANWQGDALEDSQFGERIFKYAQGAAQELILYIGVPQGYLSGRQIQMLLGFYSSGTSDDIKVQSVTNLVRKGQDAINSTTNQHTNGSEQTLTSPSNEYFQKTLDLTDATGQINGFNVSPGDILKVTLTRPAPAGTEDTDDLNFIPSSTEVKFA